MKARPETPLRAVFLRGRAGEARACRLVAQEGAPAPDGQLLARIVESAGKDQAAQELIYAKYRPAVLRVAVNFRELDADDVEDIVQESFVRAFRGLRSLKDPSAFPGWLFAIARNRCHSFLAARTARLRATQEAIRETLEAARSAPDAAALFEIELAVSCVRSTIEALPDGPEKDTARLFYLEGMLCTREIAALHGVGKSAITMRLERFRRRVRERLLAECGE